MPVGRNPTGIYYSSGGCSILSISSILSRSVFSSLLISTISVIPPNSELPLSSASCILHRCFLRAEILADNCTRSLSSNEISSSFFLALKIKSSYKCQITCPLINSPELFFNTIMSAMLVSNSLL